MNPKLKEKIRESLSAVLPITGIVLWLSIFMVPLEIGTVVMFFVGALMLIIGGVYLIWRKVINWQTPVAYIGTVAVLTFLFPKAGSSLEWMLYSIFGGGLMMGAFFKIGRASRRERV